MVGGPAALRLCVRSMSLMEQSGGIVHAETLSSQRSIESGVRSAEKCLALTPAVGSAFRCLGGGDLLREDVRDECGVAIELTVRPCEVQRPRESDWQLRRRVGPKQVNAFRQLASVHHLRKLRPVDDCGGRVGSEAPWAVGAL